LTEGLLLGLELSEKSVNVNVAVVVWEIAPLVPVIFTEYAPAVPKLHDKVAVEPGVILPGVMKPQ
jgi:hypothetical protein